MEKLEKELKIKEQEIITLKSQCILSEEKIKSQIAKMFDLKSFNDRFFFISIKMYNKL